MKNNGKMNSEFEELLRNKMDELASSVDCFDKISKRAFPQQNAEFSDSEFTVCDLENVTGKKKGFRFMPVIAAAAVFALCLFFLPKNDGFRDFISSFIGKSDKEVYRELISEIKEETGKYNYKCYDCPLEEYISSDVLITPLFSCPFEENDKDELSVRIFVKMCGSIPTNQVYAVVYQGDYLDGNYIAAAESSAKFTDEELDALYDSYTGVYNDPILNYNNEFIGGYGGGFTDRNGNMITLAGFDFSCFYKQNSNTNLIAGDVAYYTINEQVDEDFTHYYDLLTYYRDENGEYQSFDSFTPSEIYDPELMWENVVYFNGNSAKAETELSDFAPTEIFSENGTSPAIIRYISPPDNTAEYEFKKYSQCYLNVVTDNSTTGKIKMPVFSDIFRSFRVYVPNAYGTFSYYTNDRRINLTFNSQEIESDKETEKIVLENEQINLMAEFDRFQERLVIVTENAEKAQSEEEKRAAEIEKEIIQSQIIEIQSKLDSVEKQLTETEYELSDEVSVYNSQGETDIIID